MAGNEERKRTMAGNVNDLAGNNEHQEENESIIELAGKTNSAANMTEDDKRIRQLAGKLSTLPPQVGVENRGYSRNGARASFLCRTR